MNEEKLQEFMGSMLGHLAGATTVACSIVADRIGLYDVTAGAGPLSADAIAQAASTNPRLTRELLDQQASVSIFDYDAEADTYQLGDEAALAMTHRESPVYLAGGLQVFQALFDDIDAAVDTYKDNRTLGWGEHSACLYSGVKEFFRPAYTHHLVQEWLPAVDGMTARLEQGASVLDVGCGEGFSTMQLASAFPNSNVKGVDFHGPSVDVATQAAAEASLSNATFSVGDAAAISGSFDLICFFDCLHDMGDPIAAATAARQQLGENGAVMLVEPFALDSRAENHAALGSIMYGGSAMLCTPCSLAQPGAYGMGGQGGEPAMREVFEQAGYSSFKRVAETPFNIVYEARA